MPDKTTQATQTFPFGALGIDAMFEMQRPFLAAAAEFNGRLYDGLAQWNREWAEFVNRRLKEDIAIASQLADCRNPQQMYGICAEFFQRAMQHYQSEFESMSRIGRTLAEDAVGAMQKGFDDAAVDLQARH